MPKPQSTFRRSAPPPDKAPELGTPPAQFAFLEYSLCLALALPPQAALALVAWIAPRLAKLKPVGDALPDALTLAVRDTAAATATALGDVPAPEHWNRIVQHKGVETALTLDPPLTLAFLDAVLGHLATAPTMQDPAATPIPATVAAVASRAQTAWRDAFRASRQGIPAVAYPPFGSPAALDVCFAYARALALAYLAPEDALALAAQLAGMLARLGVQGGGELNTYLTAVRVTAAAAQTTLADVTAPDAWARVVTHKAHEITGVFLPARTLQLTDRLLDYLASESTMLANAQGHHVPIPEAVATRARDASAALSKTFAVAWPRIEETPGAVLARN